MIRRVDIVRPGESRSAPWSTRRPEPLGGRPCHRSCRADHTEILCVDAAGGRQRQAIVSRCRCRRGNIGRDLRLVGRCSPCPAQQIRGYKKPNGAHTSSRGSGQKVLQKPYVILAWNSVQRWIPIRVCSRTARPCRFQSRRTRHVDYHFDFSSATSLEPGPSVSSQTPASSPGSERDCVASVAMHGNSQTPASSTGR